MVEVHDADIKSIVWTKFNFGQDVRMADIMAEHFLRTFMTTSEKSDNVRAVGRALEILLAFTEDDPELSAGELLKRVDLSRPTFLSAPLHA